MSRRNRVQASEREILKTYATQPVGWIGNYGVPTFEPEYGHNFPFFRRSLVPTIRQDPRIRYSLNLLKGPIQAHTVFLPEEEAENPAIHETIREQGIQFVYAVRCEDKKIQKFILESLNRFWQCGVQEALLAIDWGFSCCLVNYKKVNDQFRYESLKHLHPFNVGPLTKDGELKAVRVRGIPGHVGGKDFEIYRMFWHVHHREHHHFWGQSRLEWAFVPWHETWTQYGARDIRRTWFYRNSYDGGTMYYPIGRSKINSGDTIENRDLAIEMAANMRTGGFRVFPNEFSQDGKTRQWEFETPTSNVTPQGLMDYPETLRLEILEAMGIPPEVVESSSDGGFGSATGRKVPLLVYYASLFPLVNNLVDDFRRFVLQVLLGLNFKSNKDVDYDIYRIVPLKSQEPATPGGPSTPGKPKPKPKAKKTDPVTTTEKDSGLSV